jgi:protein-disulfide isomerase
MKAIEEVLRQQRIRERGLEYLKELRAKIGVRVLLEPLRVAVDSSDDPSKGPAAAPVTIVEFSDFQCSYCAQVSLTLKKITEQYRDKVRLVFRDFPLAMHKEAPKAAEAAACAHEQGKYWEMHDRLFANQGELQIEDLKRHAAEINLKGDQFNTCLDSGKYAAEWSEDMKEGSRYGVSSTPVFFINGRMLTGAQPFEVFSRMIEEELGRVAPPGAAPAHEP